MLNALKLNICDDMKKEMGITLKTAKKWNMTIGVLDTLCYEIIAKLS